MKIGVVLLLFGFGIPTTAGAVCSSPAGVAGQLQWITADSKVKYCNNTVWVDTTGTMGASCAGTPAGTINYDTGSFRYCNATNWYSMKGASLGSCTGTTAGTSTYDTGVSKMKFCDGTSWFEMAASSGPPAVRSRTFYIGGLSTSHAMNLPATVSAGDLLIINVSSRYGTTVTMPGGWTLLTSGTSGTGGTDRVLSIYYKTAAGTEGGTTITVTLSISGAATSTAYAISGWQGTPEAATAIGSSTTPDPPSLSASWGGASSLFLAAFSAYGSAASAIPTGYSDGIGGSSGNPSYNATGGAEKSGSSASENPSAFTKPETGPWVAATIAIQPQ